MGRKKEVRALQREKDILTTQLAEARRIIKAKNTPGVDPSFIEKMEECLAEAIAGNYEPQVSFFGRYLEPLSAASKFIGVAKGSDEYPERVSVDVREYVAADGKPVPHGTTIHGMRHADGTGLWFNRADSKGNTSIVHLVPVVPTEPPVKLTADEIRTACASMNIVTAKTEPIQCHAWLARIQGALEMAADVDGTTVLDGVIADGFRRDPTYKHLTYAPPCEECGAALADDSPVWQFSTVNADTGSVVRSKSRCLPCWRKYAESLNDD